MKAKDLLKTIVYNAMPTEMMGFIFTPVCPNDEIERIAKWYEFYSERFNADEICILSENKEYLYIVANEYNYDLYDNLENACYVLNRYGNRIYLIELEN